MMFKKNDFEVFEDDTLSGRLQLIRQQLDPKFQKFGDELLSALEEKYQSKFYMKIAKHQRRTKNPPPDTWLAINQNKRGYKKTPHVELGLWPDRYFITFSLLADINKRPEYYPIIQDLEKRIIDGGWGVSNDHTQPELFTASDSYKKILKRYTSVKSSDFVIGFTLNKDSEIVERGDFDKLLFDKFMKLVQFMVEINEQVAN
ncbi:hypothetical protein FC72_GL000288 [Companilactobacillus tucceti DSM 20183]|uniref:Uncharacterized protein n=2 Tax=Companilactobacillus tucceti TaxID=238012 RepID=A0A0R1J6W7_9LACO|nr:hypothetical protein FC72_GL000288 [Companilactobacillus tucceti DSM 20183]